MDRKCVYVYQRRALICKEPCIQDAKYCKMHAKQQKHIKKTGKLLFIDREMTSTILDLDFVERKDLCWRRYSFAYVRKFYKNSVHFADDIFNIGKPEINELASLKEFLEGIKEYYCPYVDQILAFAPGKLILAGGSVSKAIWGEKNKLGSISDVDFFMINVENPDGLLRDVCQMLVGLCKKDRIGYLFSRNQNVTSLLITDDRQTRDDELDESEWENLIGCPLFKIQFIHRVYPSPMHVLGGFDIPSAYYDGHNIYTNSLGLFFIAHRIIFLDPSRRSTSYSARLKKYVKRGCSIIITNVDRKTVTQQFNSSIFIDSEDQPFNPCKDLKTKIFNAGDEIISIFPNGWHANNGDYDSRENMEYWKTENAYLALIGKIDHISWYGTSVESIFDKPKIQWMLSRFLTIPKKNEFMKNVVKISISLAHKWFGDTEHSFREKYVDYDIENFLHRATELKSDIETGINLAVEKCQGGQVRYIRDNPGAQYWTSAINPIVENVREYYHPRMQNIMRIGIPDEMFAIIYLGWRQKEGIFKNIQFVGDAFKLLMTEIRRTRAHFLFEKIIS